LRQIAERDSLDSFASGVCVCCIPFNTACTIVVDQSISHINNNTLNNMSRRSAALISRLLQQQAVLQQGSSSSRNQLAAVATSSAWISTWCEGGAAARAEQGEALLYVGVSSQRFKTTQVAFVV